MITEKRSHENDSQLVEASRLATKVAIGVIAVMAGVDLLLSAS